MTGDSTQRLEELILYVAEKMDQDRHAGVGRIKLAKLLWRIDFTAYWRLGHPITGATYHADQYGPAPAEELLATRDLEAAGRFHWVQDWDRRSFPEVHDAPRMELFSHDERELIDRVVDRYRNTSGSQMVDEAHEYPGWVHAWRGGEGKGALIPYESIFWDSRTQLRPSEEKRAEELAQEYAHLLRD
jgi:uncharacterized phage-associated protein